MNSKVMLTTIVIVAVCSAIAVSLHTNSKLHAGNKALATPSTHLVASAYILQPNAEPLATPVPTVDEELNVMTTTPIIRETDISAAQGAWERTWSQPKGWESYKFYAVNTASTNITIHIKQNDHTQSYHLAAHSNSTWVQNAAVPGDHQIVITTSDGGTFVGNVSVIIAESTY
ncbi:hypothetical protein [Paenibacillus sp. YYML68]|uniref:hypothetical protein n=1 Tax=Paenibacillus sp. YYML68 TaxID=2909250 RepID=UPI002490F17F|nr:hypothetical protein [Paenibacillus sp. YYML68]